ncbi:hypothetical protein K1719_026268 [Acacia pycnantha]|nr:hypothetical protein K1719_026268 [Acacia pycnantha]
MIFSKIHFPLLISLSLPPQILNKGAKPSKILAKLVNNGAASLEPWFSETAFEYFKVNERNQEGTVERCIRKLGTGTKLPKQVTENISGGLQTLHNGRVKVNAPPNALMVNTGDNMETGGCE